jgi:hypothetical protein
MNRRPGGWRALPIGRMVACALIVAVAIPALSIAAQPKKGRSYSGLITRIVKGYHSTFPISFDVSQNGKTVSDFSMPSGYPVYCEGGGFGEIQAAKAKVSKQGTFTAKLPLYFAPEHEHQGFVKVTGKFAKKGHESGKVITMFKKSTICNGTSKYKTNAG